MSAKRSILIVEDDGALRDLLAEQLTHDHGFAVVTAGTLDAADQAINHAGERVDAVILDIGMPDGDGCDFCARLRRQGHKVPVIMLTASEREADVVRGLNSGANDYVTKPFRLTELVARMRAQLRMFDDTDDATFAIGPYTFRPSAKVLAGTGRNRRIMLTRKEVGILKCLYLSDAHPVDRRTLLH